MILRLLAERAGIISLRLSIRSRRFNVRNPLQRGHRFRRKADSNPVITDSR